MVILCVLLFKFLIFRFFEQEHAEGCGREELRAWTFLFALLAFIRG